MDDRGKMFKRPMKVTAESYRFKADGDALVVTFLQTWSSGKYSDQGDKQIRIVREAGALRIAREEMLFSEVVK